MTAIDSLAAAGREAMQALTLRAPQVGTALQALPEALLGSAPVVFGASPFVVDALARDATLIEALTARASRRFEAEPLPLPAMEGRSEEDFMDALRRWRRGEFARIAWRDLAGWASLEETLGDLSNAADAALRCAHAFALQTLTPRYGRPRSPQGDEQQLIIVAMGKLGGRELNFSSDIDLVLLYPEAGDTDGARSVDNGEFFTRLAQTLIRLLETPTAQGFVFRVDLRLRPFGDSGPVVSSAAALEDYLQLHGRDWERYAWVKARPVTNEPGFRQLAQQCITPFVYRRYLDFGVFESLQEMKSLIEREVQRRELADNIKLGDGGIREIEFIVQSFQLIRGGQDRRLQHTSLRRTIVRLEGTKLLPASAIRELDGAYVFLRRLENRLQMRADQQTHQLPEEEVQFEQLAGAMGMSSSAELRAMLARQRGVVAAHFRAIVFGASGAGTTANAPAVLSLGDVDLEALRVRLQQCGFADSAEAARLLTEFRELGFVRRLDAIGARRLDALLPVLVQEAGQWPEALAVLRRLLRVLEAIGIRTAYLSLLLHQPRARERLVQLASHGDYLIGQIAAHPLLLDELIDERIFDQPPDRAALAGDLEQRLAGVDAADEERLVDQLRYFQRAAVFRLGTADLLTRLPVMQVSDRLTDVAELIVEQVVAIAWRQLTAQLGTPMCAAPADPADPQELRPVSVCVVGYGKLGGMELSYSSDLDVVFLHDSTGAHQETQGARSIDNNVFFVRFVQRVVHMLTVQTAAGRLYEVDMRLRPSGKKGLLITSLDAFGDYQRTEAWTWEHQALLHARSVAGVRALRERFEVLRLDVLSHHVHRDTLREDVRSMRNRMRQELSRAGQGERDLKQDPGGIADIEFLAQYWALLWAQEYPPVAMFADTIRQLESVASADLVPQLQIDVLTGSYRLFRACLHHRALEGKGAVVDATALESQAQAVVALWDLAMEGQARDA